MDLKRYISNPHFILSLILLSAGGLMIAASYVDSPAIGEIANIKSIFGITINPLGNTLYLLRLIPIAASLLLLVFTYFWSNHLLGRFWALMPIALLAFSPTFLAYGHYFRTEIFIALAFFVFSYSLVKLITNFKGDWRHKNPRLAIYAILTALSVFILCKGFGPASDASLLDAKNWASEIVDYFTKESLISLILILVSAIFAVRNIIKKMPAARRNLINYLTISPAESTMIALIPLYLIFSISASKTSINYSLGALVLVYILTASGIKNFIRQNNSKLKARTAIIETLIIGEVAIAFLAFPSYNSFLNSTTALEKRAEYTIGARHDLGTDLKRFSEWTKTQARANSSVKIGLDYYPWDVDPKIYLGDKYIPWQSAYSAPDEIGLSYIGISVEKIYEARHALKTGETRNMEDEYLWLADIDEPYLKIGTIWIYKSPAPQGPTSAILPNAILANLRISND